MKSPFHSVVEKPDFSVGAMYGKVQNKSFAVFRGILQ